MGWFGPTGNCGCCEPCDPTTCEDCTGSTGSSSHVFKEIEWTLTGFPVDLTYWRREINGNCSQDIYSLITLYDFNALEGTYLETKDEECNWNWTRRDFTIDYRIEAYFYGPVSMGGPNECHPYNFNSGTNVDTGTANLFLYFGNHPEMPANLAHWSFGNLYALWFSAGVPQTCTNTQMKDYVAFRPMRCDVQPCDYQDITLYRESLDDVLTHESCESLLYDEWSGTQAVADNQL